MPILKKIKAVLIVFLVTLCHQGFAQKWLGMDKGFVCSISGSTAYELLVDEPTNKFFVSGILPENGNCEEFRTPGVWNGEYWEKIGTSTPSIYFLTMGMFHDTLFSTNPVEGLYKSSFIKWNGAAWDTIANAPTSFNMYEMQEHQGFLYVAGGFQQCANDSANLIFRYNGYEVEPLVDWFADDGFAQTLEFYHDTLFIGGRFFNHDDNVFNLASVYDMNVHSVGQGLLSNCNVETLAVHDGVLWIGGAFGPGNFESNQWNYLAYYDGHSIKLSPWQPDGRVVALKSYNNELYMAGSFAHIEDIESHCIAKINDYGYFGLNSDTVYTQYGAAASYQIGIVRDMEIWNDTLYLAGAFGSIGLDTALNCIAKLNTSLTVSSTPLDIEHIYLFPNPAKDVLILQCDFYFNEQASIEIFDATGRLVMQDYWPISERKKQIFIEELASGAFVVTIKSSSGRRSMRFIKE